ncbi:tetratricopeptide repeat protein [Cyanobium sp. FGCU-52]|nr:tetratricopeptide repeat protein [Cyanobium sp. FGCU52]
MDFNLDVAALDPTLEERLLLGQAMLQSRQLDAALDEFHAALDKAPELSHVHLIIGQVHIRKHQYPEAERAFQRAAQLDPLSPYPLLAMGRLHLHCGDLGRAEEEFLAVLAINPRSDMAHVGLGRIALKRDGLEEAEKHLQAALEIVPDLIEARLPLAEVYRRDHRWQEALQLLESAPLGSQQLPLLRLKQAEIYRECHRYEDLRDLLERLRAEYPFLFASPGPAQLDLITACFATGEASAAVDQLATSTDYRQLAVRQQRLQGAAHFGEGRDQQAMACFLSAWQWAREIPEGETTNAESEGREQRIHALSQAILRQPCPPRHHPVVELRSGQTVASEVHPVWPDTNQSVPEPDNPSVLLEASGLSQPLGWWQIFSASRHVARLPQRPSFVGFLLSEQQLRDPVLSEQLALAAGLFGLPTWALRPIVSQLVLRGLAGDAVQILNRLRSLSIGIVITLDDQAQRPAELADPPLISMLRLPPAEWRSDLRMRQWSELAQTYDWPMIATGVETPEQSSALVGYGCQYGTGPLYEMPHS